MLFNELDNRTARERINLSQVWQTWIETEDLRRHSFLGTMAFEQRDGTDYLYRRIGSVGKSLGPRSSDTEQLLERFKASREQNKTRLQTLSENLNTQAAILRGLGAGRMPIIPARILRELRIHGKQTGLRVIGTNALYAYEALAGVVFEEGATATGDIDLLQDDRRRLRLLTEDKTFTGLAKLIQDKVDRSFQARNKRDYRLTNDDGYMVELIRPEPRPAWKKMVGAESPFEGDLVGAPIIGLQWLVNAPSVDAIAVDERGFPAPMTCPDPRYWAAHKLWLSQRDDREPIKKGRDLAQALAVIALIKERLPQLPIDDTFLATLPKELADQMTGPPEKKPNQEPNW